MGSPKKSRKKNTKDSQLVIRIASTDRDRFVALCDDLDTSAAREIRRFIKGFLAEHEASASVKSSTETKKESLNGDEKGQGTA